MNVSENTTFHPEYIIESILFNRGMISLVAVGDSLCCLRLKIINILRLISSFMLFLLGLDCREFSSGFWRSRCLINALRCFINYG